MSVAYKSKDIDYMENLKRAIFKGMQEKAPEEQEFTWSYVRKQVTLDDLHQFAISKLGKLVTMPTENYNGKLMVIFLKPPTAPELEIVYKSLQARCIPKDNAYITYYEKTEIVTEEDKAMMRTLLNSEISVIGPELILSFGISMASESHKVLDFKNAKALTTYDLGYVFKDDGQNSVSEKKKWLWDDMLELLKHYEL